MSDALIAAVVRVDEKFFPSRRQTAGIDLEAMVLRSDVALARLQVSTWYVVTAITKLHL